MSNNEAKLIRNCTAEFLIFTGQASEESVARKFRNTAADGKNYLIHFNNRNASYIRQYY